MGDAPADTSVMGMTLPTAESPFADLTRVLWQMRRLLERLQYHLKVQELVVGSGDDELLRHAVNDVQHTLETVAEVEAARRELTTEIGMANGLSGDPSLEDLVNAAPEPFDEILAEHRDAYLALVSDITTTSLNGRDQLERGLRLTRNMVSFVMGDSGDGGYDAHGSTVPGSTQRNLVDWSL